MTEVKKRRKRNKPCSKYGGDKCKVMAGIAGILGRKNKRKAACWGRRYTSIAILFRTKNRPSVMQCEKQHSKQPSWHGEIRGNMERRSVQGKHSEHGEQSEHWDHCVYGEHGEHSVTGEHGDQVNIWFLVSMASIVRKVSMLSMVNKWTLCSWLSMASIHVKGEHGE